MSFIFVLYLIIVKRANYTLHACIANCFKNIVINLVHTHSLGGRNPQIALFQMLKTNKTI